MAEFSGEGEAPFREGWKHGRNLSLLELANRQDILKQVGSLASRLIRSVPKSQRAAVLRGTDYIIGVASTSYGGEYNEDPDENVWIGNEGFKVTRYKLRNRWDGMEEYNIVEMGHVYAMTVWDHELTPPIVQRVHLDRLQEVLEAGHEVHKTDALLAREWLDKTRKFLIEALANLGQDSVELP